MTSAEIEREEWGSNLALQLKEIAVAWVKGQSGNPGGAPKSIREAAALAREHAPWCIARLRQMAATAKSDLARIRAMELLLERGLGKALQPIDTSANILDLLDASEREAVIGAIGFESGEARADLGSDAAGSC